MAMIAGMLSNVKKGKIETPPSKLHVDAHYGPDYSEEIDENKYDKEEYDHCMKSVAGIKKVLEEWVPEDVADRAMKSLKKDLERHEARLYELKARMKARKASKKSEKEVDEDDDSEEE